jgi:hypothetical protein
MADLPLSDGRHHVRLVAQNHQLAGSCPLLASDNDRQHAATIITTLVAAAVQLPQDAGHIVGVALLPVEHVEWRLKKRIKTFN